MSTKQLHEKTSEGMKKVSPLVAIEDIYSKLSDTLLEALVSLYNHVKCEWKGSVADTRRTVPLFLRRSGLFITYNNGIKYITEFFSAGTDQITTEGWVKDSNWTSVPDEDYIYAGVKPGFGTIGYEQLSDNLKQLFREKVNVTNFPDDEDIASVDNMLKFKNREANSINFQSKGYVILRKNLRLVNGVVKNILTQDMINQPNTIYEIRYDFDLLEEHIIIPENCTLFYNGGCFKHGNIQIPSDLKILGTPLIKDISVDNIDKARELKEANINVDMFGADPTGLRDSTSAIRLAVIVANILGKEVNFTPNGKYLITDSIYCFTNTTLNGNNCQILANDKRAEINPFKSDSIFRNFDQEASGDAHNSNGDRFVYGTANIRITGFNFDTSLNKLIWWNGSSWIDKDGNPAYAKKTRYNRTKTFKCSNRLYL